MKDNIVYVSMVVLSFIVKTSVEVENDIGPILMEFTSRANYCSQREPGAWPPASIPSQVRTLHFVSLRGTRRTDS